MIILDQSAIPDSRALAATALSRMSFDPEARKRMWAAQAVPSLVRGLKVLIPRGAEGAAVALEKLTQLREAAEQMVNEPVRLRQ